MPKMADMGNLHAPPNLKRPVLAETVQVVSGHGRYNTHQVCSQSVLISLTSFFSVTKTRR